MTENMIKSLRSLELMLEIVKFGHIDYLTDIRPHPAGPGWQLRYRFPNGYGASVIRWQMTIAGYSSGSYGAEAGLWELAVLDPAGEICYSTPITVDVLGWQTPEDINSALTQIMELP